MPGMGELLIILLIVLLIFGAGKLPAIGDALGRSIKNFKRNAVGGDELEVAEKTKLEDAKRAGELGSAKVEEAEILAAEKQKEHA